MRSLLFAGVAAIAASLVYAPAAHAGVYLEMVNGTSSTGLISGNTQIDESGITVGNYGIGAAVVSTSSNNPLALDFANFSTTGSSSNPGLLQVYVSATNLTAPVNSVINFLTQASGNVLSGSLLGMVVYTYVDPNNQIGGATDLLSTMVIGPQGTGTQYNQSVSALYDSLSGPFSETFVIDLELTSNSDISADTDLLPTIPEPASFGIFGTALLGMLMMRRRSAI